MAPVLVEQEEFEPSPLSLSAFGWRPETKGDEVLPYKAPTAARPGGLGGYPLRTLDLLPVTSRIASSINLVLRSHTMAPSEVTPGWSGGFPLRIARLLPS